MVAAVKRYPTANCLRSKTVSCFGFVDARATAKAVWFDFQVWLRFSACVMTVFFRLPLLLSCLWRTPEAGSIPPAIFKAIRRNAPALKFDDTVLEVGTGSGYQAAELARLVRKVCTIEIIAPLAATAAKVLRELGYDNVSVKVGDGYLGWPECGSFDAMHLTMSRRR
jgi:hypothetical protein